MAAGDERYDRGGKFMNYATFESHLCGTFKSRLCVPQDNFKDLGDLLLPNSSYSISWNELELDSDGEIRLVGDFERNPVSPTLILNNNGALDSDGEIRLVSDFDRNPVSPNLILNDYGGDGTAEENAREEVKGGKFPLELSKKVRESNHQNLDVQRQQWQNFPRVIPNFPDSPSPGSKLALDSNGEIWSVDAFERNPVSPTLILNNNGGDGTVEEKSGEEKVSPTFILNNNGGDGTVQENTREEEVKERKFPLGISKKVCKSSHRQFGGRRQQWQNFHQIVPNFLDSPSSGSKLALDSDGEIWSLDDFERNPVCPALILNNNCGYGTVEVSPNLILNNNGGDGTAEENTQEEVKGGNFPLELSKKVRESNHQSLDVQRQQWQNFPWVIPNFPYSTSSGSKLSLDSDDEIWSLDAFERNPVFPTLILNNNCGYGTVEENSWEEKVSPTLILNNNGGDGTVQEKTREEVKARKFPLGVSKSSHPNFGCRRQQWQNFPRVVPNFPDSPSSGSESMSDLGGEIGLSDDFDRNPVSTTFFLNDNGGNRTVEENSREDEAKGRKHPPDFSEKAPKSNHWSLACRRQQLSPARRCTHCQSEKTPQWRAGPMGPKTLCNACGVRHKSGRLLPEYRPAASPSFDSLKHSNFHRKIERNLIRNQLVWVSVSR